MTKFIKSIEVKFTQRLRISLSILLALAITGCGGSKTFNDYARAGDTVAVPGGFVQNFQRGNISVEILQGSGGPRSTLVATYNAGNPAIRASVNLYPDPISSLVVSRETGIEFTDFANTYHSTITNNFTGGDKDWYQTTVFVDLPTTLITGDHVVRIKNTQGESFQALVVIVDGIGTPSTFSANGANLGNKHIAGISRLPHFIVGFNGSTIPHAIEITLAHDPDSTAGGTGKAYAVNPIGYKKNIAWTDDGTVMKAILTPTTNTTPDNIIDYKFYVTGAVNNLIVSSVSAFDINGNPVPNVQATTTFSN